MTSRKRKILFVCTEDWFFCSHFLNLIDAAKQSGDVDIALAATFGDKKKVIEQLGVRPISVDFDRASMGPGSAARLLLSLSRIFRQEQPDIIHFIALKPIVIGGFAAKAAPKAAKIYHLTGQGYLTLSRKKKHKLLRAAFYRFICHHLRQPNSWLLIENPDDANALRMAGTFPKNRESILGGAGVDPTAYPALPTPDNDVVHLGFVGRLIWSKGVDILVAAMDILKAEGHRLHLDLYGEPDPGNPRSVTQTQLDQWNRRDDITWHGRTNNVLDVWGRADIAVIPSRGGEGMPRVMLEAASCARALIVSDVPGCRHFVTSGTEGLVVPPEDPPALARAIAQIAGDEHLRLAMSQAARARILAAFTRAHVCNEVAETYKKFI